MSRKLERQIARAQAPATDKPAPVQLIATIRKSRAGHTAVIDSINQDGSVREMHGTCSAASMPETIAKTYELMAAEMDTVNSTRLLVEGAKQAP